MYRALALKPEFADGYAAAAEINGWLIGGKAGTTPPDALLERRALASLLLSRARAARTEQSTRAADPGPPEAQMMMAHAYLAMMPPRRSEAEREARAALALVPNWSYVRDHLLLQIATATPPETGAARCPDFGRSLL